MKIYEFNDPSVEKDMHNVDIWLNGRLCTSEIKHILIEADSHKLLNPIVTVKTSNKPFIMILDSKIKPDSHLVSIALEDIPFFDVTLILSDSDNLPSKAINIFGCTVKKSKESNTYILEGMRMSENNSVFKK